MKKIESLLEGVLKKVEPSKKDLERLNSNLKIFNKKLSQIIKESKIDAQVFVGGSFAKKTMIKKEKYDIDIFLRFDKKYKKSKSHISDITHRILKKIESLKIQRIHGSRDYFRIYFDEKTYLEIVPVIKARNPDEAENITDLSYHHVKYINKKIRKNQILKDIVLAKSFCYANNCYGAESYIKGFSGYSLELLIYYYGGFLPFIKKMSKIKKEEKLIIDIEKHYKNKKHILIDLNPSKIESPIILIDPTYKQRNALATLSDETFEEFKKVCKKFLKSPNENFFKKKKINLEKIKKESEKKGYEFLVLEVETTKQEGNIAGSKLLKFYNHLCSEIEKFFIIKKKGFSYLGGKKARYFFSVKNKDNVILRGPKFDDKKNLKKFKKKHQTTFIKLGRIYAEKKITFNLKRFISIWKKKNFKKMKEMSITRISEI